MAPRVAGATKVGQAGALSAMVAVKCDLCGDRDAGPACVRACPVEAIARVEPLAAMADVRQAVAERVPRARLPRARPAWPWALGAALLAIAIAGPASWRGPGPASGVVSGALVALLVAYSALKRSRLTGLRWWPGARTHAVVHFGLGIVTAGVVFWLLKMLFQATQSSSESKIGELAGTFGHIITPIPENGVGEIAYVQGGSRYSAPAREETGSAVPVGAAVKIVRIVGSQFYVKAV